jgi:hypothetical protein
MPLFPAAKPNQSESRETLIAAAVATCCTRP